MLFFVGPQDVPRPMGHLARGGDIGQEHKTAGLVRLAGHDLRPLVQGALQAIPQRFDHPGPRGTRPPRAIRGALRACDVHSVLGALECPQLGGSGFGIRVAAILWPSRLAHGRLPRRV